MKNSAIIRRSTNPSDFYDAYGFVFRVQKKSWFKNFWEIIDKNDNVIFSFSIFKFLWFFKLKIVQQQLTRKVYLQNKGNNDRLIIDNNILKIKAKSKIFKFEGEFLLNEQTAGKISQTKSTLAGIKYEFEFFEANEFNYYFLLLFAIYSVGFAEGGYV